MAETTYKKGELLFEGDITTDIYGSNSYATGSRPATSLELNQDVLLVEFNEVQYICEVHQESFANIYGGVTSAGPVFIEYPFAFCKKGEHLQLFTEAPGTYSLKIYTAVEDTDSSTPLFPTDFIIDYLMKSPQNSNWNVLSTLLGDGDWLKLKAYVETTPKNMNRQVLKALLGNGSSGSSAIVGTAVVGTNTVG